MALHFPGADDLATRTAEAFADPRPGDVFEDMLSSWAIVTAREGDRIVWVKRWGDGERKECAGTLQAFRDAYHYRGNPGYSVKLYRRGVIAANGGS
jgi:hypothetical protein